jgi:hypothetical protein
MLNVAKSPKPKRNPKRRAVLAALGIPLATFVLIGVIGGTIGALTKAPEKETAHRATTTSCPAGEIHNATGDCIISPPPTAASTLPPPTTAPPTTAPSTTAPSTTALPTTRYVPPPPPSVTYDLTGQGAVSVTLENASGGTEQFETPLPFHRDLGPAGTFGGLSGFVYISAQLQDSGTVTCTIKKGDQVIQTATSTGQYVIASCSGSV